MKRLQLGCIFNHNYWKSRNAEYANEKKIENSHFHEIMKRKLTFWTSSPAS